MLSMKSAYMFCAPIGIDPPECQGSSGNQAGSVHRPKPDLHMQSRNPADT